MLIINQSLEEVSSNSFPQSPFKVKETKQKNLQTPNIDLNYFNVI